MAQLVCGCAAIKCSFGAAPSMLMVLPINRVMGTIMPNANIMDNKPLVNILPFGMCNSLMNPMVAAATAAALGALTPMPCLPATTTPWAPGSPTVLIGSMPALNNSSKLNCLWGGLIEVTMPGQFQTLVP